MQIHFEKNYKPKANTLSFMNKAVGMGDSILIVSLPKPAMKNETEYNEQVVNNWRKDFKIGKKACKKYR